LVLNAAEWQELLLLLPEIHTFRSRFGNTEAALKREPDSGRIRAALAGGTAVVGAELRRGYHVRLA